MILGCARPSETHTYVIIDTGDPIQGVDTGDGKGDKIIVTGNTLKGGVTAKQDVTGWIMMPPSHWAVIGAQLEKDKSEGRLITFPSK